MAEFVVLLRYLACSCPFPIYLHQVGSQFLTEYALYKATNKPPKAKMNKKINKQINKRNDNNDENSKHSIFRVLHKKRNSKRNSGKICEFNFLNNIQSTNFERTDKHTPPFYPGLSQGNDRLR